MVSAGRLPSPWKRSDPEILSVRAELGLVDTRLHLKAIVAFIIQSLKDHVIGLDGGREAVRGVAFDVNRLLMPGSHGD